MQHHKWFMPLVLMDNPFKSRTYAGYFYARVAVRLLWGLSISSLLAACTVPRAPAAPIGQRVLIPTPESRPAPTHTVESTAITNAPVDMAVPSSPLTAEQNALLARLPSRGAAPELLNETWFNSEPLRLADLRGKVVIVEFWTYG